MYVCMYGGVHEMWGMTSYVLSYCMGRVPYLGSGMKIYSSVQEEGDCASIALGGSEMKSAPSQLQQGYTDRQKDTS